MQQSDQKERIARLHAENIGGIEQTSITFPPGVTVLAGRNATNRTSLLRAVMTACGSDKTSLKADADCGEVTLTIGNETHERTLTRNEEGEITVDGDPYLNDSTLADLFAFLLESNETRRAVNRGDDLRDIIMRPVDTDGIDAEIERLTEKRRKIDQKLDEIDSLRQGLPELEERRSTLRNEIEEKRQELEEKESKLETVNAEAEAQREAELEEKLDELNEKRSQLDDVRYDLETEQERLDALRSERQELEERQVDPRESPTDKLEEITERITDLRERKQQIETQINDLQSTVQFNEEMLEESAGEIIEISHSSRPENGDAESLTDQLMDDENVTCWTCGSDVEREKIESTIDSLRQFSMERRSEIKEIETELDDLTDERNILEEKQRERQEIDHRLEEISDKIEESEERIQTLQEHRDELSAEIEEIESEAEEMRDETSDEVLDLHREANQLEYEIGKNESKLDSITDEIRDMEDQLDRGSGLQDEREQVQKEIEELRTKIDSIEAEAVKTFNEHIESILDLLEYGNIERIWIERFKREERQGQRKIEVSDFELHVVRTSDSGITYEDTSDNLSESEREVTGLVFALAGYLTHSVHRHVPFVLLDSLETIDAPRISKLIDYFQDYTNYLVVALLPEDAESLSDEYTYITDI